jgi:hypothetical protein
MNTETVEYRVVPVTRYQVTRYHGGVNFGGVGQSGEYGNAATAYEVAYALCKAEHERLGWPVGDERIVYPAVPDGVSVLREPVAISAHYPRETFNNGPKPEAA